MSKNSCYLDTQARHKEVSKLFDALKDEFPRDTFATINNAVGMWQSEQRTQTEFPTANELKNFIIENRQSKDKVPELEKSDELESPVEDKSNDTIDAITSVETQQKVDLLFDPQVRRDRATLIARLFSNEVTSALKEMQESLMRRRAAATSQETIDELQEQLNMLDRYYVMSVITPANLFRRVYNIFNSYVRMSPEERIQHELYTINEDEDSLVESGEIDESERYSTEKKLEIATKRANHNYVEYMKMIEDPEVFRALAEEASVMLASKEGIRLDPNYIALTVASFEEIDPEDGDIENLNDPLTNEETYREGWITNFRNVSSHETLSAEVRAAISEIPKLDKDGMYEEDDLGHLRYLDEHYVHAALIDKLRFMITSDDMIPLLKEFAKTKPWVNQIIEVLEEDETLFSKFYQDFRKDFTPYWIQKKRMMPDGTFKIETISINKPEGIYYLLDSWRDNYESGTQLDKDSIYNKDGSINTENAKSGLSIVESLNNLLNNKTTEERLELLEDKDTWDQLMKALHMIGIDANPSVLKVALTNIKKATGITFTDPIMLLLPQLNTIFSKVSKGEVQDKKEKDGTVKRGDLINTFGSIYNSIALMLADVTEDAIESSTRENGKSYYSHTNPNYLGKLIKNLKNVMNDKERFDKFIKGEFKDYEWFYKNGEWLNDWVEQLVNHPELRKGLDHKVLLNSDKVKFQDWDSLDHIIALLTEYWGDPDNKSKYKYAWYHVPMLSDASSAEFIRFIKYTGDNYDNVILDKLVNLVTQEYNRIMLVKERAAKYKSGDKRYEPIANFDMTDKSIGGAEFKFLPRLNSYKTKEGELFIDKLTRLKKTGSGEELRDFIREALSDIMEEGFEEDYKKWYNLGLFDELPNGKYKYLPFSIGQSHQNGITAKALERAKNILGQSWSTKMEELLNSYKSNTLFSTRDANNIMEEIKGIISEKVQNGELDERDAKSVSNSLYVKNNAKEALREYYWNSKLATSQIIQLTTTDLAFYKNYEDFIKRFKEIYSPALRLNTKATFKGELVGRDWERTIYIKDDEIVSSIVNDVKSVITDKYRNKELSAYEAASILSKFGYSNFTGKNGKKYVKLGDTLVETSYVNVTDAQAYRSLSSYRAVLAMSGEWNDKMEQAYNNFKKGVWNAEDFNIIWQTKKPFLYTQTKQTASYHTQLTPSVDNEGNAQVIETEDTNNPIYQKVPVTHKNSEFLLLAMYDLIAGNLGKSNKLRAINKFMEDKDNQIDVVQFESTTKVGKQGVIDLSDVNTEEEVLQRLREKTGLGTGNENPNVVHKVSYEDYGIQTATPEHFIGATQLIGTQFRKLIGSDVSDNAEIEVNGQKYTKKEWLKLYNEIITENILQAFLSVSEEFKDPKRVEKILLDEVRGNPRYGMELIRACTLDGDDNFNIPLYDPIQSQRVQQLLNSVLKARITKQTISGGALIQVSSYGLTDQLNIVFKDSEGNSLSWDIYKKKHPKATREEYENFVEKARASGGLSIQYFECYLPAYSKDLYEPLMDPNTHILDINKRDSEGNLIFPEELRKAIGYRIPTESYYSMVPIYIKGFLPQQNGSAIMLPAEITTLSGSDYDVDKLYVMLPKFNIIKYDKRRAMLDYAKVNAAFNKILGTKLGKHGLFEEALEVSIDTKDFENWFNQNKEKYKLDTPIVRKVKYNMNKSAKDNGLDARNNLMIDMSYSLLTSKDIASKILTPGGFDEHKKAAKICSILNNVTEKELAKLLVENGIQLNKTIVKNNRNILKPVAAYLFDLELGVLNKIADSITGKIDPLSPMTQIITHKKIMDGVNLIGVYANHNVSHALMQHTKLELKSSAVFTLNGKSYKSLHSLTNDDKVYISRTTSGFVGASVDNAKEPTLGDLNQNSVTVDASMLLARLGYNVLEIGLLMNQPIIMDIVKEYSRDKTNLDLESVIEIVLEDYMKKASVNSDLTYEDYKKNQFLVSDLAENILMAKEATTDRSKTSDMRKLQLYQNQVAVGFLFKKIIESASALKKLVQVTRSDTQNGSVGPTIADTELKIQRVLNFIEDSKSVKFPLDNADVILDLEIKDHDSEGTIREKLLNSPLPYMQAFYTLGVAMSEKMLGQYFPQFSPSFREVITALNNKTKSRNLDVKTVNSIYNDLFAYIMSSTSFFKDERDYFINKFPQDFKEIVSDNPDIAELEFIKRLRVVRANNTTPVQTLVFKNVGHLSAILKDRYSRDWVSLLYSSNPKARKLALDLFKYNFYRNGFAFGPNTFIHLAPVALRRLIPGYINKLRALLTEEDDFTPFIDQYLLNHLDNRKLVPEIKDNSSAEFINDDGDINDEVEFVISENAAKGNQRIIRKTIYGEEGPSYIYFDYIGKMIKGRWIYYKLTSNYLPTSNGAIYTRVEPLGNRNNFIEYEYGADSSTMQSVLQSNKLDYDPNKDNSYGKPKFTIDDATSIDYGSLPKEWDDIPMPAEDDFSVMNAALKIVFGESLDNVPQESKKLSDYSPNEDFTDENNDPTCK